MRIALVTLGDPSKNPRCRPLVVILERAGHEVSVVSPAVPAAITRGRHVQAIPTRIDRMRARWGDRDPKLAAVVRVADDFSPDVVYPLRERDLVVAEAMTKGGILSLPGWRQPEVRDFVWAGAMQQGLTDVPAAAQRPSSGVVNIVARFTATTPARYLASGFSRVGFDVHRWDGGINWEEVSPQSMLTVFVEAPYPALDVQGAAPDHVPVLYWVHHGEHHQAANLRLADRYGADAVMLAHSWHLAHQYVKPVFSLPFGVPTELTPSAMPFGARPYDVAMVASGLDATDGWYERRGKRVRALQAQSGLTTRFAYGLQPADMLDVYSKSRLVINDGGRQHQPITMRIFEAFGAGAALATELAPGLESMFTPGEDFAVLTTEGAQEILTLLANPEVEAMADRGHTKAMARHTYDDRARTVAAIASSIGLRVPSRSTDGPGRIPALVASVRSDVDVQTILVAGEVGSFGVGDVPGLEDRDIRFLIPGADVRDASYDAVVVGDEGDAGAVTAARYYVYVASANSELVDSVAGLLPTWRRTDDEGIVRLDSRTGGYRVRSDDHPLR